MAQDVLDQLVGSLHRRCERLPGRREEHTGVGETSNDLATAKQKADFVSSVAGNCNAEGTGLNAAVQDLQTQMLTLRRPSLDTEAAGLRAAASDNLSQAQQESRGRRRKRVRQAFLVQRSARRGEVERQRRENGRTVEAGQGATAAPRASPPPRARCSPPARRRRQGKGGVGQGELGLRTTVGVDQITRRRISFPAATPWARKRRTGPTSTASRARADAVCRRPGPATRRSR